MRRTSTKIRTLLELGFYCISGFDNGVWKHCIDSGRYEPTEPNANAFDQNRSDRSPSVQQGRGSVENCMVRDSVGQAGNQRPDGHTDDEVCMLV